MSKRELIEIFSRQSLPISSGRLLRLAEKPWASRTLRRWLADLTKRGILTRTGNGRSTRYALYTEPPVVIDEVRVRYRQQRRGVVRDVLLGLLHGNEMEAFVQKEAEKLIPAQARDLFIEDIHEDLRHINTSRLVGLGVTPEELEKWHKT